MMMSVSGAWLNPGSSKEQSRFKAKGKRRTYVKK